MRYRKGLSVPAIFILMLFCLWLKKHIFFLLIVCVIAFVLPVLMKWKKNNIKTIYKEKKKEDTMRKINSQEVFEFLAKIPAGKVVTYGMVASYLGDKNLARTVGNILKDNPDIEKYPCYKVVNWEGKLAKHYTFGGIEKQKELLIKENIEVKDYKVDLKTYKWNI